jgi:hypothetical protein
MGRFPLIRLLAWKKDEAQCERVMHSVRRARTDCESPTEPCATLSFLGRASSAIRTSLALMRARRIFLSSELVSNVISRLQFWQFVWNPFRIFCARFRNICEHFVHLIFTFSSIINRPWPTEHYSPKTDPKLSYSINHALNLRSISVFEGLRHNR